MSSFAAWGLTVLGLAVVTTVAEMLLPHGKTRKVIRSVFATVTALVIVTPLPGLLKSGFEFDFDSSVETDETYLEYIENAKKAMIIDGAEAYLKSKGIDGGYELDVELSDFSVKSVYIKFSENGMTANGEHINKSEIIGLIADYFDIGEEAIMAYG